jgi:MSHA pilin protein MshD
MFTRTRGVTLVELIMFIVIVGVAMSALFAVFSTMTKGSGDPQVRKQVLAIAESLMDEVTLMPFTFCDPNDANVAIATNSGVAVAGGCATLSEDTAIGPEAGETRYGPTFFDNVSDYSTFALNAGTSGIRDITNNPVAGLGGYTALITVTQAGLASGVDAISAADALRISITVQGPGNISATLEGYRTRYAPNTTP